MRQQSSGRKGYVFLCGCVLCALVALLTGLWLRSEPPAVTDPIRNAADCQSFLLKHGIAVEPTPLVLQNITLPTVYNAAYEAYAALQERQGLPLREYAGRQATLYVYEERLQGALLTVITCEGEVVAADRTFYDISPEAGPLLPEKTERNDRWRK